MPMAKGLRSARLQGEAMPQYLAPEARFLVPLEADTALYKFKGASADVADKIAKQLARDAEKADSLISVQTTSK